MTTETSTDTRLAVIGTPPEMRQTIQAAFAGRRSAELAQALAGRYPPEYFLQVAITRFTRSPALWGASLASVYRAIVEAAQMGLPFLAGRAYLVPFRNSGVQEAQLIIGYQGLVDLVSRGGLVVYMDGAVVRERDHFRYVRGTSPLLEHVEYRPAPDAEPDPGDMTHVWALAKFRGEDQPKFDVMTKAEVEVIRLRAPSARARTSPWTTDYFEMAKKTVLRRLCKTLPLGLDVMQALETEDQRERDLATSMTQAPVEQATTAIRQRLQERVAPEMIHVEEMGREPQDVPVEPAPTAVQDAPSEPEAVPDATTAPPAASVAQSAPQGPVACGATVMDGNDEVVCVKGRGHRSEHSDGRRDWPRS